MEGLVHKNKQPLVPSLVQGTGISFVTFLVCVSVLNVGYSDFQSLSSLHYFGWRWRWTMG